MDAKLNVVSPIGEKVSDKAASLAPRLDTLDGKTVCEIWNGGFKADVMFPIIEQMLRERYPTVIGSGESCAPGEGLRCGNNRQWRVRNLHTGRGAARHSSRKRGYSCRSRRWHEFLAAGRSIGQAGRDPRSQSGRIPEYIQH
ncbi:MAG: hypothetical protein HYS65_17270 [Betaproteobacteria bacterium]|nr:hypothetical protein [Betaproteobacteria bacterium]